MRKIWLPLSMLFLLIQLVSCKEKQYLVGYFDYPTFSKECHWESFVDQKFEPKGRWADSLKTLHIKDSLDMQIFLGCYCGDSKKWVPRFFKMKPTLPISQIDIISVDTTKKDEKNLGGMVGLKKIPTFIFYRDSKEIGRIVERPKGGLEKSLFKLLKKCE